MSKARNRFSELTTTNPKRLWPEALSALVMGLGAGGIAYAVMFRDLSYSHFIAGYSTWLALGKNGDYALIVALVVTSPIFFFFLINLKRLLSERFGQESAKDFSSSLKLSLIPFGFWGINLLVSPKIELFFPILGVALLLSTVFLALFLIRHFRDEKKNQATRYILSWITFWKVFAAVASSGLGFLTLTSRIDFLSQELPTSQTTSLLVLGLIGATGIAIGSITSIRQFTGTTSEQRLNASIRLLSMGSPLMLLVLIPESMKTAEGTVSFTQIQPALWVALTVLILIAGISISLPNEFTLRRTKFKVGRAIRGLQLIPILVFLKTPNTELPRVGTDDYHIGEFTVPGLLLAHPETVVYDTYDPARGFVNFIPGIVSNVFFDGSFASYTQAFPIIYAAVLLLILPILSLFLPPSILLLGLLSFPAADGSSHEIYLLSIGFVLIVSWLLFHRKEIEAFSTLLLVAPIGLVFAPGQFALSCISLAPSLLVTLWRNRLVLSRFVSPAIVTSLAVASVFLWTNLNSFIGAIRYGLEQSSANTEAYGMPWAASLLSTPQVNVVVFEFIRSGWILIPACILMVAPWLLKDRTLRERALFFLLPVFLITVTVVLRVAVRIDPGALSRLGQVSALAIAILLPVILFFVFSTRLTASSFALFLVPIAVFGPLTGNAVTSGSVGSLVLSHLEKTHVNALEIESINRTAVDLPAIGGALMDERHKARLLEAQSVLTQFRILSHEFLDLTDRGATYSYLGYFPPMASDAVYNLSSFSQQSRAVSSLISKPPKAIRISAENIPHDGGPISIRTPQLYDHLLQNIDGYFIIDYELSTWLISIEKTDLHEEGAGKLLEGAEARTRLGEIWGLNSFKGLPSSWGSSITSLESQILWGSPENTAGNITLSQFDNGESYELVSTSSQDLHWRNSLVLLELRLDCPIQNLTLREFVLGAEISIIDKSDNSTIAVFNVRDGVNLLPLYATSQWVSSDSPTLSNKIIDTSGSPCGPNAITQVRGGQINLPKP